MGSQRSKEDEVFKISTSVFVTNFPDQFNAKELWNTCKQYGFVVDAFIPTRRSKAAHGFLKQATCDFTTDGRVSWVEIEGKSYWIHAKEVPGCVPDFVEDTDEGDKFDDDDDDEGEPKGVMLGDSDVEAVPDIMFKEVLPNANGGDAPSVRNKEMHSEDSFNIYDLLKDTTQEKDEGIQNIPEDDVSSELRKFDLKMHDKENGTDSACSGHLKKSDIPYLGGSILLVMDEYGLAQKAKKDWVKELCMKNKVNFLSLQETKMEKIKLFDIKRCWGNFAFEYVHSDSVGNSGGILCVWDINPFFKHNTTISDYFVAVRGEVIIMGDFNEVRNKTKRFRSVFNVQGANAFNTFISSSGLAEVPLGGCSFTWCHKSATKMSKLDRMVEHTWNVASAHLDALIDNGEGTEATVQKRTTLVDSILKDEKLHSMEVAPKAKIKWAIERDENSKFYHGILNKRNQLSIRGVLVDGIWIENPSLVKTEFLNLFKSRFQKPSQDRLYINLEFPRKLSSTQQANLEIDVSNEEIKKAVWDCGIDKSPGPDGFTFGFYRHFWKLIEKDVVDAVKYFFKHGALPKGSNSSFIALIPKTPGANMVKDFRPISLIGSFYKIIAKVLANRLIFILGDIVNEVTFTLHGVRLLLMKVPRMNLNSLRVLNREILFRLSFLLLLWKVYIFRFKSGGCRSSYQHVQEQTYENFSGRGKSQSSCFEDRALMFKWVWRFTTQRASLWARVIKAIHEDDGKMCKYHKSAISSPSLDIIYELQLFKQQGAVRPLLRQNPSLFKDHGGVFIFVTIVLGSMAVPTSVILILARLLNTHWANSKNISKKQDDWQLQKLATKKDNRQLQNMTFGNSRPPATKQYYYPSHLGNSDDVFCSFRAFNQKINVINMIEVVSSKETMMNRREEMEEWMNTSITFPLVPSDDVSEEPLIVEAEVERYLVRRVYVDERAPVEVMFEHCFENLSPTIKSRLKATQTDLVGFSGEITKPVGKIKLDVCFRNKGMCRRTTMKFTIIRAPSPYNIILGRMGHKTLRAIPSNIHSMIIFPTLKGIATLITQSVILSECRWLEKKRVVEEPAEENPLDWKYVTTEKVMVNPAFSNQLVVIGGGLSKNGMDIVGPLPQAVRRVKFIIVAVEYFTKWIEATPLAKIIAHPQANGLVESANKSLMEGIKTQLGRERAGWVEELPNVLRAHRTSIKQSNGETPFSLTYRSEAVIPAEIGMSTYRTMMIREEFNKEEMRLNLDLI
nr:reverse transcriptase domain-containing protein [Tanacetum cinerariifolium]